MLSSYPNGRGHVSATDVKRVVLVAAAAMLVVACGAYAAPGSRSSPPPRGGISYDIVASETVHEVSMHVGQRLEVVLHESSGLNSWSHPVSSDRTIVTPIVDPAATAAQGVTLAAFEALRPGQVMVSANATPACKQAQACPMFIAVYSLKVTVTQ